MAAPPGHKVTGIPVSHSQDQGLLFSGSFKTLGSVPSRAPHIGRLPSWYWLCSVMGIVRGKGQCNTDDAPQHFLNFLPLPQGHGSLRPTFLPIRFDSWRS